MAHYAKASSHDPASILEKALEFFGPGGVGLKIERNQGGCAAFSGGGGHVSVRVCGKEGGTDVELETVEWDYQAQRFLARI